MERSKLLDIIPPDELKLKLRYGSTELDPTFLCFEHVYLPVSKMVFHDKPYWLRDKTKNYLWVYCDNVHAEGIFVEEIEEAVAEGS